MIVRLIRALSAALIVPVGASLFIAGYFAYKKFGYGPVVLAALVCAGSRGDRRHLHRRRLGGLFHCEPLAGLGWR